MLNFTNLKPKKNTGQPTKASPVPMQKIHANLSKNFKPNQMKNDEQIVVSTSGLTKRDYFAIKCLEAILANCGISGLQGTYKYDENIKYAVFYADKLLDALQPKENQTLNQTKL